MLNVSLGTIEPVKLNILSHDLRKKCGANLRCSSELKYLVEFDDFGQGLLFRQNFLIRLSLSDWSLR